MTSSDHHHQHHHHNDVGGGPPVLDIGGDIGAMIATMDREAAGSELHLRSEHEPPISIHTGVWDRHTDGDLVTAAVFAELVAGTYWVLDGNGAAVQRVEIEGGALATIDLRR